jgi:hypothetical protein
MKNQTRAWRAALAVAAGGACMLISDNWVSLRHGSLVTEANAVIGRPLTPGSVAGVARRTGRRAVRRSYYGGSYGAGYYGRPYYARPYGYYRRY